MATTSIPTGSVTIFYQSAAPVKWTKNLSYNDYALRITSTPNAGLTSGPTSTVPFSTLNATSVDVGGSYTITGGSVNPATHGGVGGHSHPMNPGSPNNFYINAYGPITSSGGSYAAYTGYSGYAGVTTGAAGGGAAHNHTVTSPFGLPIGPYGATSNFSFSVKYLDVILCTRTG